MDHFSVAILDKLKTNFEARPDRTRRHLRPRVVGGVNVTRYLTGTLLGFNGIKILGLLGSKTMTLVVRSLYSSC